MDFKLPIDANTSVPKNPTKKESKTLELLVRCTEQFHHRFDNDLTIRLAELFQCKQFTEPEKTILKDYILSWNNRVIAKRDAQRLHDARTTARSNGGFIVGDMFNFSKLKTK